MEDERAGGVAACPPSRQRLGNGRRDREYPPHQRLRTRRREPDDAAGLVNFVPSEAENLVLAPAGVVGEVEDVLPRGGEMGDPAAGGNVGPELPDLIVLEVGVDEIPQGRSLGAKRARRRRVARKSPGWWSSRSQTGSWAGFLLVVAAAGKRRPSTFALVGATGKGNVRGRRDGDVWGATSGGRAHIYGAQGQPVRPAPPSKGDAVVAGLAACLEGVRGQRHGDDRIGGCPLPNRSSSPQYRCSV